MALPDIQDQVDERGISLDNVGIDGVRMPSTFSDGVTTQAGVASFEVVVQLPEDRRGTHMSRMVELVHEHLEVIDPRELPTVLKQAASRLDVGVATIGIGLPFATRVLSPVSGREAWQPSDLRLRATLRGDVFELVTSVTSEVTSLCPCSKAISDYGAHNQRSVVTVDVHGHDDCPYPVSVARLVELIRLTGSCPVFPIVKRPDERSITMTAFEHAAFVEDMARDLSGLLRKQRVRHSVRVRNLESIHSHDAIASLSWRPEG
ncbi:GTP cyclohydrolase FolE2 [Terrabacter aerolatus]|uniref:GTP cyclohydrolase FolE2 n=1 Tax=Terrabacter aerolatus TaxID=422442 RepID=A0A512D5D5_9MICO|nr:GTP cyclohydrolase FolE2 [Terrabacter aerolatus]GEO31681.1 GTP cyclohydrolase FolE2 [Terrabacter aerolatus]